MDAKSNRSYPIITIGSGNVEYILEHNGEIELGKKHIITSYELSGGSCVNYSLRLLTAGNTVYPVPLIGEDSGGQKIRHELIDTGCEIGLTDEARQFIESNDFFIPGVRTPKATVLVHKGRRTILSEAFKGTQTTEGHLHKRFQLIRHIIPDQRGSVMIGHITLDGEPLHQGAITKRIINSFSDKFLLFANFGNSQLKHGIAFWKTDLEKIDLLQLNLEEIRELFKHQNKIPTLYQIIKWLREHSVTAVITLSRFGAVGTFKNGEDGITLAWPLEIGKIVDPTGAGDAFAAGMVTNLNGNKDFTFQEFQSAIIEGRLWASYACTTIGACGNCPSKKMLRDYSRKHAQLSHNLLEITDPIYTEQIMNLIDKEYYADI